MEAKTTRTTRCPSCGEPATAEARYCSHCGQALQQAVATPQAATWYSNVWFVLFLLFFVLGPLALPLVWKHPRFSRRVKVLLTVAMLFYTLLLIELIVRMVRAVTEAVNQFNSTLPF
ncbi:MAG TPA: hypothetical protein DDX89_00465 [Candidatus Omnitrophica bacterium]|nr:MAG: hypothetical protein A2Z92_03670 [Omnitrophica WOR_2 bacterium GWA2_63_20]OGX17739.1 MAG: hypothetical protein A2105_06265 [Omnitrophica WOR_2 bacterium GWF2_63_9]OGX44969.1 MAG: hypothetical protein A3I71_07210 [Omnitrophica WOR_2 bacterium RIFCSPLOWO2_02_FULL_63_16]OGX49639.1 MAG: hypothetical protein A3G88_02835 [Omnitrophica WOR_2 bacterium RIFCSPLOWO2_12_FULL_63_16]HAM40193.1 hypothetical protein [Candidatus Omnitrophota bacterium]